MASSGAEAVQCIGSADKPPLSREAASAISDATQEMLELLKRKRRELEEDRQASKRARTADAGGLYGDLPAPDPKKDRALARRQLANARPSARLQLAPIPPPDRSKVIFLDIDGVLRPMSKGGFQTMMVDGEFTLSADTSDFLSGAMLALRHIVEKTGAVVVLSSEWRRDDSMREGVNNILREYEMPPLISWTPTDLERELGTANPFQAFIERRAREISQWLRGYPHHKQWVVLDDINMAAADKTRKPSSPRMAEHIVQSHYKVGLTLTNAKAAVRLLQGEKLPPQILKVQPDLKLV